MRRPAEEPTSGQIRQPTLDRLLRFDRDTEARYEAEHGAERAAQLRGATVFGLLLYFLHDISTILLLPESYLLIVYVTLFAILPYSLLMYHFVGRISHEARELLTLSGLLVATVLPLYMMYVSDSTNGIYMNLNVVLCIVFGNVLISLRFRHAFVFTSVIFAFAVLAITMKDGIDHSLKSGLCFQFATVCILGLYSNYLFERRRCVDYCVSLGAVLRAETAEISEKQFQVMSRTDSLTGLPNRRFLDERLDEWFADSRSAVVMMIDIDHFKLFNDTLGHPAGDDCLKEIAEAFRGAFPEPDFFCAWFGGEEFTLSVRGAEEPQARRLANTVVRSIEALKIPHPGRSDGINIVTISVGVALKPQDAMVSRATVLSQADEALYRAKHKGRNCFVINTKASRTLAAVNS
ncbi:diguanylate cyclase (GGDEF) domain-containing protein [Hoeflea sp. IMCC20628]|uniref:sensor domain-containing diguanylate cyclase n=1 Tax=Hoeflea sp. IMCC20628 TaxID=1620421 RepID=UPI00063A9CA4|nr:GGDEF domain-containing protein [Hoeflea sp. IMCC20628]AKH99804.1 diguanylate cyclase (GGDEF) domain-containing protein [Hoeflea sp. IMCC20628]